MVLQKLNKMVGRAGTSVLVEQVGVGLKVAAD